MSPGFEQLALRCWLGLGCLERRGSRGRPWLTLIRPGGESSYLRHLGWRLVNLSGAGTSRVHYDWIPGEQAEDVLRLRFHSPLLEPLLDLGPDERWERVGEGSLGGLWLDRGLWKATGRGAEIRVRRQDSPAAALEALHRWATRHACRGSSGRGQNYVLLHLTEQGVRELIAAVRPQCPGSIRFTLRRWASRRRHGLMALGRALGTRNASEWRERVGFLP